MFFIKDWNKVLSDSKACDDTYDHRPMGQALEEKKTEKEASLTAVYLCTWAKTSRDKRISS